MILTELELGARRENASLQELTWLRQSKVDRQRVEGG